MTKKSHIPVVVTLFLPKQAMLHTKQNKKQLWLSPKLFLNKSAFIVGKSINNSASVTEVAVAHSFSH